MSLQTQLDQDLATSMKEGVVARTSVLRLLKSSLKNEQIKVGHDLSEAEILTVLQREAKQRKDSITQYQAGG
ncbi:MAG TPA: GatB/YqeY domain-containing protein, partial [Candidatus Saccharimonadales bacterium]|nr:GatB/YqeY domain-containing protein [Candidatus Saccharimonadales bacterium]